MRSTTGGSVLVVDAANVVGSRPDGWWKDRAGAAARLIGRLQADSLGFDQVIVVLEGQARAGAAERRGRLCVVHADADGDTAIVQLCRDLSLTGADLTVATADRGLLDRLQPWQVTVMGPRQVRDAGGSSRDAVSRNPPG
ncbi:MAG: hypothetical protein ACK5LS_02835 [Propioniciclava sp.]